MYIGDPVEVVKVEMEKGNSEGCSGLGKRVEAVKDLNEGGGRRRWRKERKEGEGGK